MVTSNSNGKHCAASANGNGAVSARRPLRVLVVDDDRDTVLTTTALLREEGYDVRGVHNGEAALIIAGSFEPDVYLIDITLPAISGYDVARAIRAHYGRGPVLVAVTGAGKFSDRVAATLAGFNHHLLKPYGPERLLDLLQHLGAQSN